jgi:hypothetical protein
MASTRQERSTRLAKVGLVSPVIGIDVFAAKAAKA